MAEITPRSEGGVVTSSDPDRAEITPRSEFATGEVSLSLNQNKRGQEKRNVQIDEENLNVISK